MLKRLFSRPWITTTLLVMAAVSVMIRLGFWQLDRLEQRRAFNAHYLEQRDAPILALNPTSLDLDLEAMEYRQVSVSGVYDHSQEVAIRNQSVNNQAGVHLLTPLKIIGSDTAILVDRGWIPLDAYQSGNWERFSEPGGVSVSGIIRLSQRPTFGGRPDPALQPGESRKAWNFVAISETAKQLPYPVLPVYIQQSPDPTQSDFPIRNQPEIEISEGPHLGYAVQWLIFATILGIGYPWFVRQNY